MEKVISRSARVWRAITMALQGKEVDGSTGDINLSIILLSLPMILEMLMESLFSIVDVFFVGRLGISAVAVVGLTESVMSIIYSIGIGLSIAATAVISRRVGERKFKKASQVAIHTILLSAIVSILTGILGYFFAEELLVMMGASQATIQEGLVYAQIVFAGNIAVTLLFVINGIFRGTGNAGLAMKALWLSNILNIVLDPLLIFGFSFIPGMGLKGAAIATVLGRLIGVFYQLYLLFKGKTVLSFGRDTWMIKTRLLNKLTMLSVGGMSQFVIESISWIFLIKIVAAFGDAAVAGYTIAYRILVFSILPGWGMANAAATLVGQNLGAGNTRRAEVSAWRTAQFNMIMLGILSAFFFLFPETFIGFFTQEAEVLKHGSSALKLFSTGFIFFACGMVLSQSFNGAGDVKTPAIINILIFILIQIPLAWALAVPLNFQVAGVYIAIAVSYGLHALLNYVWFKRGDWKSVPV